MAQHASMGDFGKSVRKMGDKFRKEQLRLLKETVIGVVTEVARDTPILTGQAQSNWLTNPNAKFPFYIWNEDSNGAAQDSIAWANRVMGTAKLGDKIHITNSLPYIAQLNRGTSRQAPALFVQAAVLRASYSIHSFKVNWT